jgi:hypothetical protein
MRGTLPPACSTPRRTALHRAAPSGQWLSAKKNCHRMPVPPPRRWGGDRSGSGAGPPEPAAAYWPWLRPGCVPSARGTGWRGRRAATAAAAGWWVLPVGARIAAWDPAVGQFRWATVVGADSFGCHVRFLGWPHTQAHVTRRAHALLAATRAGAAGGPSSPDPPLPAGQPVLVRLADGYVVEREAQRERERERERKTRG